MTVENKMTPLVAVFLLQALLLTDGYKFFQDRIPNGEFVPHPCQPNKLWKGVGHENRNGGGKRNAFGKDFLAHGKAWNRGICEADSDGDGRTNGQELGDPKCVWTPGKVAQTSHNLSHPGICEPFNSPACGGKPDFVNCEDDDFKCDAVNDADTFNFTVRLPATPVPAKETTYTCMLFELPNDGDYHLVAGEPLIDNANVMHHLLIYGCSGNVSAPMNEPYECSDMDSDCFDIIAGWTVGSVGQCSHPHTGFRIGTNGLKVARMELHWNNPLSTEGFVDGSGMMLYLSSKLRMYDAGILAVGQMNLIIPPGKSHYEENGKCSPGCTRHFIKDKIYVTSASNYMHYLGVRQVTELYREGKKIQELANDQTFSYDNPVEYTYPEPVGLLPGDEIRTKCVYKSTSRDHITYYGEDTSAEMCFSFLSYYPKENVPMPFCVSYAKVDQCDWYTGTVQGCEFWKLLNASHPETIRIGKSVMDVCSPHGKCLDGCTEVVRELKQQPCFQGDIDMWFRQRDEDKEKSDEMKIAQMKFYAALDSCDREIALETASVASFPFPVAIVLIASVLVHLL